MMSISRQVENVDLLRLEELINTQAIIVADFWAPWCAPCLSFSEIFSQVAQEEPDIHFAKMNVSDAPPEVMETLGIMSIPHLMIFKQGVAVFSEAGSMPYAVLKDLIQQSRDLVIS
ncbi:MAG TPA: thiol reductase thioredoxin [Legionellales bacterium]|nr:thiol reductase thioredoxin [Legionellales bacterium]